MTISFREFLRTERKKRGWTQGETANRSFGAIPEGTLASWESGHVRDPGGEAYAKVARTFGMPIQDVYSALGLSGTPVRRETARELLHRAMVQLGEPIPVMPLSAYDKTEEARMLQVTGEEVHVHAVVAPTHHLEAYQLSESYPCCHCEADTILVIDLDRDIAVGDVCLFICPDGPQAGVLRRVGDTLWLENERVRYPYERCERCACAIEKSLVLKPRDDTPSL